MKQIQKRALINVKEISDNGIMSVPDSVLLFLYRFEFGSDEPHKEIREWIVENTRTDEEFIEFISVFSEKARNTNYEFNSDIVWVVYTDILEMILGNSKFLGRLKEISSETNRRRNMAAELISRIEHEKNLKDDGLELSKILGKDFVKTALSS